MKPDLEVVQIRRGESFKAWSHGYPFHTVRWHFHPEYEIHQVAATNGRYFVGDREALRTDVESLKRTIAEVAGDDRKRVVLLRADARTPHQAVVTALDALGQLGFREISIGTAPDPAEARR